MMAERITLYLTVDGVAVSDVFAGTARAAYLGALRQAGFEAVLLGGRPSEVACAIADIGPRAGVRITVVPGTDESPRVTTKSVRIGGKKKAKR
jgi:hypothetical protein